MNHDATHLLGRASELTQARSLLEQHQNVTLLGPPGIGKSRLAAAMLAGHDGAALMLECEDLGELPAVHASLARQLHVDPDEDGARIVAALQRNEVLVVVDGFEHLRAGRTELFDLLASATDVRVLVTSRVRTQTAGEVVLEIGPLGTTASSGGMSDAAKLFVDRASRLRPEWDASGDLDAVEELVTRLDGIPLAIELAASRVRSIGPADLLSRLGSVLHLAGSGEHRRQTLRAAIDVSWEGLSDDQRDAFMAMSAFAGPFDLLAVEAVVGGDDPAGVLESLVDHSLVRALPLSDGRGLFGLYAVMRAYAAERLVEQGDEDAVLQRVARHVSTRTADFELRPHWVEVWRRYREGDAIDPASAARCALAIERSDADHGTLQARLQLLDELCDAPAFDELPAELRCETHLRRGALSNRMQKPDVALRDGSAALAIATQIDDAQLIADCEDAIATALRAQGEDEQAEATYRSALERIEESAGARIALNFAGFLFEVGRLDEARNCFDRALTALDASGDERALGVALTNYGVLQQELGDWPTARDAYDRALRIHEAVGHRRFEAITLCDRGGLDLERGYAVDAAERLTEGIAALEQLGERRHAGLACAMLAAAAATAGERAAAQAAARRAAVTMQSFASSVHAAAAELYAALVAAADAARRGELEAATAQLQCALDVSVRASDETRLPLRILRTYVDTLADDDLVLLRRDGTGFTTGGETIDLDARPVLARVAAALAEGRLRAPGVVSVNELIAAGWPGERILEDAATNRLQVTLSTLRRLGLRAVLERVGDGYALTGPTIIT